MLLVAALALVASPNGFGVRFSVSDAARGLAAYKAALNASLEEQSRPMNCSIDLRPRMQVACKQAGADWCWATGLTEFSFFYNASSLDRGDNCSSVECSIVSYDLHTQCCPYEAHKGCGADGQSVADIVKVANGVMPGEEFRSTNGPLHEADLQAALMSETPIMPIIMWEKGGGHALMVAGCEASTFATKYYLHDPEYTTWRVVEYMTILNYLAIQQGHWTDTVMHA